MKYRDRQLIKKIIAECNDITRYTNETGKQGFLENDVYQKATAMSLLNIGEHANILTRELWVEYNDIQWRKIVDLRNIVAHGYGELRMELVWNLSQKEVPILVKQLKELLHEI
ncbi:MAG: DUF86 domain-containing protein [Desulfotomaculum sp.]|nr:DUF86 domain-containing protein [Desulfotomaculum sp.]